MKRLYLVRHAKSSWGEPGQTDFERSLDERGKRDAPMMGKRLQARGVLPELIVSSPAKRAIKTARVIAEEIGYPAKDIVREAAIYNADLSDLIAVVRGLDDSVQEAMLFGHNPGFTALARSLVDSSVGDMSTCAVFCAAFDVDTWQDVAGGGGQLEFFDFPKLHG
ncbi:MAG: histidine phosphatase family protein [bacterium]|nr:histidine phosphatase family protein [bacterium]